ncbi:bifunctional diaminohydroxyphosphoribosylaminopyrimidine deaminase/5-amino-6-(5-phosphoribosylamino)uracil reductase RibD [Bythopirellula polymerisocia]|uniref:Riboflavin biosynthesis protein RibD n=1 Tax=Bythopirellula polymerisocia TaxID=2528003 RepID=A0A5C6CMC5_9BACT|nr:bifunctional diaminohydroxyphosphoribosylaminopyrimidine deaminase/5-amino-6-(5-phosphoribosylamino)uracil reductase RibD [Bythopirellula polymerisocia]TWU25512.1 Riboflavin biosynthesis protein RibD [Bythopirellula polymerisocia]
MNKPADNLHMTRALELAEQGRGYVEPNPMVGCVIVQGGKVAGEGWHQKFGGPHAEIVALAAAGKTAKGAEVYVTLEPCCHQGKTPPCTDALIKAGVTRVVVGCEDPNPQVAGKGISQLREAGIEVELLADFAPARRLIAPFAKLVSTGRPWVIAKWAMTLDGKLATHTGDSQWISGEASRAVVHHVRGLVDGIVVGKGTVVQDDPTLTARPAGARVATRIVLDSLASLSTDSRLVQTLDEAPVMLVAREDAPAQRINALRELGVDVLPISLGDHEEFIDQLLDELGRRQMTNLLVEGGATLLGILFDLGAIDEVHVFVAPKLVGGQTALTPVAGQGLAEMATALELDEIEVNVLDGDVHIHGYVRPR